jgi:hypothetical protein
VEDPDDYRNMRHPSFSLRPHAPTNDSKMSKDNLLQELSMYHSNNNEAIRDIQRAKNSVQFMDADLMLNDGLQNQFTLAKLKRKTKGKGRKVKRRFKSVARHGSVNHRRRSPYSLSGMGFASSNQ